ncbi:MAG: PAS domain S-box protein [Candidatus Zixiibacteriota bacterium]|nr:MAG: PAS domain S-box protein [candidate division Zixibacteria bacterium]
MNKGAPDKWQRWLGSSYEIRIRVTLGLMFLLIIIANLNSLRFFGASKSLQNDTAKYRAVGNLDIISRLLKTNPLERSRSTQFRDLAETAGFAEIALVETEALQHDDSDSSGFVDAYLLQKLRSAYNRDKEVAGALGGGLPATMSTVYMGDKGEKVRTVAYHFVSDKGEPLTLLATIPATIEAGLQRFSALNALFQFLSMAAAFTIAILLLKITLKPYRQIKNQALAADVGKADQPEAVDFAVNTFQKVIGELRHKEAVLQRLYAQQKDRATSLERYNEYILAGMSSAMISCDARGAITNFNRAAERICNVQAVTAARRDYHQALADYPVIVEMIREALEKGKETSLPEMELCLADGRRLWLSVTCSQLRDTDNSVIGAMVLATDLTDLKRLEAEIRIKEQMAALGEMAAGLAHQLRNSLAAVVGFAQLLKKLTAGTDGVPDLVLNIINEAQTTEEMLTRFLTLSRSERILLREVEFAEIQRMVENHFAEQLTAGGVKLVFAVDNELPALVCDPILITNALINLIQNGIEASAAGSEVRVEGSCMGYGQPLLIRVIDSGEGIPVEEIDKIFLPFYTSGKATGTGLGLSLVRKWVVYHSGEITCQSTPNRGTIFTIKLPRRPAVSAAVEDSGEAFAARV